MNNNIFISRIMYLSNKEKELGLQNKSNICKFYSIEMLQSILNKNNKKTYFEHLVDMNKKIRLVIDFDIKNTNTKIDNSIIKKLFTKDFYNFIKEVYNIKYIDLKKEISISKSVDDNKVSYHIIYPNIILTFSEIQYIMKHIFKNELIKLNNNSNNLLNNNMFNYVDLSIYKKNMNLRCIYSPKINNGIDILIPITNKSMIEKHLFTNT